MEGGFSPYRLVLGVGLRTHSHGKDAQEDGFRASSDHAIIVDMTPNRVGGRSSMQDEDFVCPREDCTEIGVQTAAEAPTCPRHRIAMITLSEKRQGLGG